MLTVAVAIGDGITAELPAEWVRIADVKPALEAAWRAYGRAHFEDAAERLAWLMATEWWFLLLGLWQEGKVELASRRHQPYADLTPMNDFPPTERDHRRFDFDAAHGQLKHLATRPTLLLFDLHVRAAPSAGDTATDLPSSEGIEDTPVQQPPAAPPRAPDASPRRQRGDTDRARGELLYQAALLQPGSQTWSAEDAFREALILFPGNPLLNEKGRGSKRAAWRLAKVRLPTPR